MSRSGGFRSSPKADPGVGSRRLVQYWIRRWLAGRIDRPGILESVASHTLVHPIRHGARVTLPEGEYAAATQQPLADVV